MRYWVNRDCPALRIGDPEPIPARELFRGYRVRLHEGDEIVVVASDIDREQCWFYARQLRHGQAQSPSGQHRIFQTHADNLGTCARIIAADKTHPVELAAVPYGDVPEDVRRWMETGALGAKED